MNDKLLTVEELAQLLGFSCNWVRLQVKLGRIPAIKFNKRAHRFHWPTVMMAMQKGVV